MSKDEVVRRTWRELEPHLDEQGYELIEVEFGRVGGLQMLRLFIDRSERGVTLDDCQAVTRLVSPLLDAADYLSDSYTLEVSSPGFDRPVRRPKDFARFIGERIKVRTNSPVNGRKTLRGVLSAFEEDMAVVDVEGVTYRVHLDNLHKANLDR